jgi:hypothetical protein
MMAVAGTRGAGVAREVVGMTRWASAAVVFVLLVVAGLLLMMHPWSGNAQTAGDRGRDAFAADRAGPAPAAFDATRAMGYLEAVCKIGPRISGTEGMRKQQELLEKHFKDTGATVRRQEFTARQRSVGRDTPMTNLIVSWHPERRRRVILCSHYDTRPLADQEPDPRRWREPFVSANDGGSGVALLMELAHPMAALPAEVGVDFVFFDGEEYVFDRDDEYFFGSKQFARQWRADRGRPQYLGAVLLDMVGGKDAHFPMEQNSLYMARDLVREVWGIAAQLGCTAFRGDAVSKDAVLDDHVPLNQAGIPAVDVIDFEYRHWHRLSDRPENCSGESLGQVARVLSVWLQRLK